MNAVILDSVIRLTEQRDIDSLAYSLIATIAEMLPIEYIALSVVDDSHGCDVALDIIDSAVSNDKYQWHNQAHLAEKEQLFVDHCMRVAKPLSESHTTHSLLAVPIFDKNDAIGAILIRSRANFSEHIPIIVGMARIYSNHQVLLGEVEHDQLTGLYNRRHFDRSYSHTLSKCHNAYVANRHEQALLWLVSIDIDNFKKVNDQFGHICGDEVLLTFANTLKLSIRAGDLAFRFGGEEFVVLINAKSIEECYETLHRLQHDIAQKDFPLVGKITVSIGFTQVSIQDFPLAAIERSDKAMYYAKNNGRNQIQYYEELASQGLINTREPDPGEIDLF